MTTASHTNLHLNSASERVACSHCGLPVPAGLLEPEQSEQFCCRGCQTVYGLISKGGLDRYYAMRRSLEDRPAPARTTGERYEEMDESAYQALYVRPRAHQEQRALAETELMLEGVHCAACVWLVERLGRVVPGVVECRLNLRKGVATVAWNPQNAKLSAIARGLDGLGYPPHPPRAAERQRLQKIEDRAALIDLAVAGFLAGNVMLIAFALYGGLLQGMAHEHETMFRWVSAGLGILVLAWPGRTFFRGAWAALRTRSTHLDVPIALALAVGGGWGLVNTIRGEGEIYFDSLSALVFLLLVGRTILRHQQRRASSAIELLYTMTPSRARRVGVDEHGAERLSSVPVNSIELGELLEVRPGEIFPVDGWIERGQSTVDASMLTGEPMPVPVVEGECVAAGTVNGPGLVRVRVMAVGDHSRLGKLMHTVAQAATQRSTWVHRADRIAGVFVILVIIAAVATLLAWWPAGASVAIEHTTALLIVSCPCALGLATPLVMSVATGRLASKGVLVKGGDVFEKLSRPGLMLLDKTGTLTEGSLRIRECHGSDDLWPLAIAVERLSQHAVARTVVDHLSSQGFTGNGAVDAFSETLGRGVRGMVDGQSVLAGSRAWMLEHSIEIDDTLDAIAKERATHGWSTVWVSVDGVARGMLVLGDAPRSEVQGVLESFRQRGWTTRLLTGDRADVAEAIGLSVGFRSDQIEAELTPEDKLHRVRTARAEQGSGPVVMIGDGVNDAAAMAASDVGIAVRGGAEASLEAADVYLQSPGLGALHTLFAQVRGVRTRLTLCMFASVSYNLTAATLAIIGVVTPIHAAIIMPASSLTVLAIASVGVRRRRDEP